MAIDTPDNKLVANSNYVMAALQTAEIASAAGHSADATKYAALAALLSSAMTARFWNSSGGSMGCWDKCSQSAQALCLALGVGGESKTAPAGAALLEGLKNFRTPYCGCVWSLSTSSSAA